MRLPNQIAMVNRVNLTHPVSDKRIYPSALAFRKPLGGSFGHFGGVGGEFWGSWCEVGCDTAYAACLAGCTGISSGFGAAICAVLCDKLHDECLASC
jgi:hypothetical protein